jgi:hypothetical protein
MPDFTRNISLSLCDAEGAGIADGQEHSQRTGRENLHFTVRLFESNSYSLKLPPPALSISFHSGMILTHRPETSRRRESDPRLVWALRPISGMRLWSQRRDEESRRRVDVSVQLCYRIGALAQLIEILVEPGVVCHNLCRGRVKLPALYWRVVCRPDIDGSGRRPQMQPSGRSFSAGFAYEERLR